MPFITTINKDLDNISCSMHLFHLFYWSQTCPKWNEKNSKPLLTGNARACLSGIDIRWVPDCLLCNYKQSQKNISITGQCIVQKIILYWISTVFITKNSIYKFLKKKYDNKTKCTCICTGTSSLQSLTNCFSVVVTFSMSNPLIGWLAGSLGTLNFNTHFDRSEGFASLIILSLEKVFESLQ